MARGDDPTRAILSEILEALREGRESRYGSETSRTEAASRMEQQHSVQWMEKATDKTIKQMVKIHEQYLQSMNVEMKKGFKGGNLTQVQKTLEEFVKNNQVSNKDAMSAINTYFNRIIADTNSKERVGKGSLKNVYGTDNAELKKILAEMRKSAAGVGAMDSSMTKLMEFFKEAPKKLKRWGSDLVQDLAEGLGKSKWIGGTMRDTARLIGLLGANWMSQFGQLGRIIGGAFYVAMETIGPQLISLLLQGMGRLLTKLPGAIGNVFKGAVGLSATMGGPLSVFAPGRWGMMSTAGKVASVGRLAGALGVATGASILGGKAISEGVDSWKQGRKGNAVALGTGGLALIGGGIAAAIAGTLMPITIALLSIGAVVAGIAALWKKFGPSVQNYFKERKEASEKSYNSNNSFFDWLRDIWPWGKDKDMDGGGDTHSGFLKDFSDARNARDVGRLKVAKDGSVLNASSFSQAELKAEMEAYQRSNPEQFKRIYEVVGSKYASLKDFKTDAVMTDAETGKLGAIMYKGASSDMERIRSLAREAGMSEDRVNQILYTGGWSTGKGPHSKGASVANAIGHDNRYALAYDIGLAGFSKKEQEIILAAATQTAEERAKLWGGKVQDVYHEITDGKKHTVAKGYQEGPGQHIHTQLYRGYAIPEGARDNIKEQKAAAYNQAAGLGDILHFADIEAYKKVQEATEGKSSEEKVDRYKKELKKLGIEEDPVLSNQYRKFDKNTGMYEYVVQDKGGNLQWTMYSSILTRYSNTGAGGF